MVRSTSPAFTIPGEILGLDGPATGSHSDTAVALTASTACDLGLDKLPEIWGLGAGASLLRLIAEHERNESMLRINLSQSRAEARIAGFLKLLMDRTERLGFDPTMLSMPMSRTDLANHLGSDPGMRFPSALEMAQSRRHRYGSDHHQDYRGGSIDHRRLSSGRLSGPASGNQHERKPEEVISTRI